MRHKLVTIDNGMAPGRALAPLFEAAIARVQLANGATRPLTMDMLALVIPTGMMMGAKVTRTAPRQEPAE